MTEVITGTFCPEVSARFKALRELLGWAQRRPDTSDSVRLHTWLRAMPSLPDSSSSNAERIAAQNELSRWARGRPDLSGAARLLTWIQERPALALTSNEVNAVCCALLGGENGLDIRDMVVSEIAAKSVLPEKFGYEDLGRILAAHPDAINSREVIGMLKDLLRGGGVNDVPTTTPKQRRALLVAFERGQRLLVGDACKRISHRQDIWWVVQLLRGMGYTETGAVAEVAKRLKISEPMVRKYASMGRRMAGQAAGQVGSRKDVFQDVRSRKKRDGWRKS